MKSVESQLTSDGTDVTHTSELCFSSKPAYGDLSLHGWAHFLRTQLRSCERARKARLL
ncbi:unnamed protein product [Chondrus crispus]|uniref:Uncharacterized protein n=1 Tax=Chondrus crispus TaxID=2769 RepID=R7QFG2_CHOCR|nr:unnamed protein product [Chondrus crispus]CDF36160.1 unnamed protein product [Chondrus crispus]|eukprot:XP_005715979.1 unnamed protein product [Chondrus crispus]